MESAKMYFSCGSGNLDIFTLRYRWFGALWQWDGNSQIIVGYWFGDKRADVVRQIKESGWSSWETDPSTVHLKSIYDYIRKQQKDNDWENRSRLPFRTIFTMPWKDVKPGWYILRSRKQYPFYISSVHKKGLTVWLMHTDVCENEKEVREFIQKVNLEHGIEHKQLLYSSNFVSS